MQENGNKIEKEKKKEGELERGKIDKGREKRSRIRKK